MYIFRTQLTSLVLLRRLQWLRTSNPCWMKEWYNCAVRLINDSLRQMQSAWTDVRPASSFPVTPHIRRTDIGIEIVDSALWRVLWDLIRHLF
jgi:hypothetical protein